MISLRAVPEAGTIRLVSPANFVTDSDLEPGIQFLQRHGYQVQLGSYALSKHQTFGGTDKDRAADIMDAFNDPNVDAVICCRGGYGCARLVPYLDFDRIVESPKPFFGYSDITTIHLALNRRGLPTFYAPMVSTLQPDRSNSVKESFLNALRGVDPLAVGHNRGETLVAGSATGQ